MKKILIDIEAGLGMDCTYCGHSLDDEAVIELEDSNAEKLQSIWDEIGEEYPTKEQIQEQDPDLAEVMDVKVYLELHDLMVIQGWEEYGWQACCNYIDELMEEDIENGDFVFICPEDIDPDDEDAYEEACQQAWEEQENELMGSMDTHDLAVYLEGRYGLDTDISDLEYGWSVLEIKD